MKLFALLTSLILTSYFVGAQTNSADSSKQLREFVVSGFSNNSVKSTSMHIERFSAEQMAEKAAFNLSDVLSKQPGIAQMTTSNSISKPVIRGLYGNRILVLFSGLRFDNQQWQDEHGLGLSQIGLDRVEVIKGPASLLYGSDAMGGVINIIEEKPMAQGKSFDFGTQLFSNTLGILTHAGFSKRDSNKWSRLRVGVENHADYADGAGTRVLNSRNGGYYVKGGFGFERKGWIQENSYNFSYNQFGFIMPDLATVFTEDGRYTRSMAGPHHNVMLNMFHSQNTFLLEHSTLKLNVGVQSNSRKEDEGGGQISLNMHLISVLQNLKWERQITKNTQFVANQQFTFENNTNYGGRIIIPDATFFEGNLSGYLRHKANGLILEAGLGANFKNIKTLATRHLNTPNDSMQPFVKNHFTVNGMAGAAYNLFESVLLKANVATGFRSPNLAELSSNGIHEGVYRYELGDPNLKPEQNLNMDVSLEVDRPQFYFNASLFDNVFKDYVYLAPTQMKYYGFQVFKFMQQDANLHGAEVQFIVKPQSIKGWELHGSFASITGTLGSGGNLPFIPAAKVSSSIRKEWRLRGKVTSLFIEPEHVYVFEQSLPAQFETFTGSYYLVNLNTGMTVKGGNGDWHLGLAGTNLTNNLYADHLSRLKYYGIYNQGINFVFSVRKSFKW